MSGKEIRGIESWPELVVHAQPEHLKNTPQEYCKQQRKHGHDGRHSTGKMHDPVSKEEAVIIVIVRKQPPPRDNAGACAQPPACRHQPHQESFTPYMILQPQAILLHLLFQPSFMAQVIDIDRKSTRLNSSHAN